MPAIELHNRRRRRRYPDAARYLPALIALPVIILAIHVFLLRDHLITKDGALSTKGTQVRGVKLRNQTNVKAASLQTIHAIASKDGIHHGVVQDIPSPATEATLDDTAEDRPKPTASAEIRGSKAVVIQGLLPGLGDGGTGNTAGITADSTAGKSNSWSCQIIYIVGVEGSGHHGVADQVVLNLARRQVDAAGHNYTVLFRDQQFRQILMATPSTPRQGALAGAAASQKVTPEQTQRGMNKLCGPKYGGEKRTVIIEDISFPYGFTTRRHFKDRPAIDVEAILEFSPTPVDLRKFADIFAPHADVKFIVLHRPFFNTAISHSEFMLDGGIVEHGTLLSGHLMYLGKIFQENREANMVGSVPWKLLCVDQLRNDANTKTDEKGLTRRDRLLGELSKFLEWDQTDCERCFKRWFDSKKNPKKVAGQTNFTLLEKQRDALRDLDIWPPGGGGDDCPL